MDNSPQVAVPPSAKSERQGKKVSISFYGAAGEVTGSNFLIKTNDRQYIVDCGLFQGERELTKHNNDPFAYNPNEVDAVIVTHAHLDHVGRLPKLVRDGYKGPIFGTAATLELAALVLEDAFDLSIRRHERDGTPIMYEKADLQRTLERFQAVAYHQAHPLFNGDSFTLYDAGHILGSASIRLSVAGKELVFSGDVGHAPSILLPPPEHPKEADAIIVEGTYGGRERDDAKIDRLAILKEAVEWVIKRRGVLLIPAFSVERSQELLYLFNQLFERHQLPKVPIFLDSPLAIEALRVFERHQELYRQEVQQFRRIDDDIFSFNGLALSVSVDQSKSINNQAPPKIILAGSGMMEGGRIHHHLKHYLSWPNTYLLVVGYQAQGTIGQQILQGNPTVRIFGDEISVRAKIVTANAFSGHADNSELLDWIQAIRFKDGAQAFIVHADSDKAELFKQNIEHATRGLKVSIPSLNDIVEL